MATDDSPPKASLPRGEDQVILPEGVSVAEWSLERNATQNPRIRTLLGSLTLLEGVFESNYAILHCSPERLHDIWSRVREVARIIREDLTPLLEEASVVPALEEARQQALAGLEVLVERALDDVERLPEIVVESRARRLLDVRKRLCVAMGQVHDYLQDAFARIMAADPRSLHHADYYLSKRFPRDIDEAEWLHASVVRLERFLRQEIDPGRREELQPFIDAIRSSEEVPGYEAWEPAFGFLTELISGLTPRLKEVAALRGIRFDELEIVDRYTTEIPARCSALVELYNAARETVERLAHGAIPPEAREQVESMTAAYQGVFAYRMGGLAVDLDSTLKDLAAFLPLWLQGIERRRALLLKSE